MSTLNCMSDAVRFVIDNYPAGHQFFGNELHDDVARVYPQSARQYPDTIMRMARRHRRDAYRCINRDKSLYMKV